MSYSEMRHMLLGNSGEREYSQFIAVTKMFWSARHRYNLVDAIDSEDVDAITEQLDKLEGAVHALANHLQTTYASTNIQVTEAESYKATDVAFDEAHGGNDYLKNALGEERFAALMG